MTERDNHIRCKRDGRALAVKDGGGQCVCPSADECRDPAETPPAPSAQQQAFAALEVYLHTVLYAMLRGVIAALPNFKGETVLVAVSRTMGHLIGLLYIGDRLAVHKLRGDCRRAFRDALLSEPIKDIPKAPAPGNTAAIKGGNGTAPLKIVPKVTPEAPDWPPAETAIGHPDGLRKHGSTGQLFEARDGRWERVREAASG